MARFAMLFPGQGAQSVGMLAGLAEHEPVVERTYAQASEVLDYDLGALINEGPADRLDQTEYTQPALVAAGVAVWRAWRDQGGAEPAYMAGHSLGEYTALVAAGALDFADALRLTRRRGQAMQTAVPAGQGAMSAILGLDDDSVQQACREAVGTHEPEQWVVSPANFNAPGQVVIAGHAEAVDSAGRIARDKGAKLVKALAVSVPSHCALMRPAAERLATDLADIALVEPRIPVLHNIDGRARSDAEGIRNALVDQLTQAVFWHQSVTTMREHGCDVLLECGPGRVLTGLNKRIDKSAQALALADSQGFEQALQAIS